MAYEEKPTVGISALLLKPDEKSVLFGKRYGIESGGICFTGNGEWNFPGGGLRKFEMGRDAVLRELGEETGLEGVNIVLVDEYPSATTETFLDEKRHFITLYYRVIHLNGTPRVKEPKECLEWKWYQWNKFPEPLYLPVRNLISQGYNPFKELKWHQ